MKQYWPGQRILLQRNPYYWKTDRENHRLPYLDELAFLFVGSEDAQVMRFEAGETDVINRLSSENYALLSRERARTETQLVDLGPSLEYNFLLFNLNDLSGKKLDSIARKQLWFQDLGFRQAYSAAIDRDSIVSSCTAPGELLCGEMLALETRCGSIRLFHIRHALWSERGNY